MGVPAPTAPRTLPPELRGEFAPGGASPLIEARNLTVSFKVDGATVEAVRDATFQLGRGETVAIVGESGSGKSVTARAVMGLLGRNARVGTASRVLFEGRDLLPLGAEARRRLRGSRMAMIFQEPMSSLNPVYTVGAQIAEALRAHARLAKSAALGRARELLEEVGIPRPAERLRQYPHQLSGGQRQRVMIAMALANRPDVLIADEPTTALDVTVQAQILNLIRDLQRTRGMTVALITHDLTIVRRFADYVYVMRRGRVREHGPTAAIFEAPKDEYTRHLLASEPKGRAAPAPADAPVVIEGRDVKVAYTLKSGGMFRPVFSELVAVDGLSLALRRRETLGLVGESGSGKTTFGQALMRLVPCQAGEIAFDGARIDGLDRAGMRPLRRRMQIVFQDPFSSLNPRMSVGQIIAEGLKVNGIGANAAERADRVRDALRDAGMPDGIAGRFPHEFSGGQRQRIAIARAIALEPEFILLDEPTSALDLSVQAQVIALLRRLQEERGLSYLFISHDLKVVRAMCHRVIVMRDGRIVEQGPVDDVLARPRDDYTKRLVRAAFEVAA
ncbi:MAG: ABC transporter ATP-binding protein [Hyphomicrobiales bacterium]|nr:ABC transporter ATP-binding protein [Hyphomicrobiales bacterium]MDE2017169.1 ABC transporter ATP-binding protein [Hyphomicrobiales bacterium]